MKTKNLLLIGIGAVVLYFVYKKMNEQEEMAQAKGDEDCYCQGYYIGAMSVGKCKRMCRKANNFNFR